MVWNKNKQAQKKRKQSSMIRKNSSKRQQYSSIFNAINTTAPQAIPLSIPAPVTTTTEDDGSPIVVNGVEIPSLCANINRKDTLEKALEFLTRTKVEEDPSISPAPLESSNCSAEKHRACVCVICDSFIIGTEEIVWLSKDAIKSKSSYLSTSYYQANIRRGVPLPPVLRNQYIIEDDDDLKDLLLSPRAHKRGDTFMACTCCSNNIKRSSSKKPPRFGISNGWVVGYIPSSVVGEVDDLLAAMISHVRFYSYVFSYIAGAHKSIKGHHTFFLNDPEHIGATFNYLRESGAKKDVYVMLCGRMTPSQREIAKKKCEMDSEKYMKLLKWLIEYHPSYKDMTPPEEAPSPVPLGGFHQTQNNTDESDVNAKDLEDSFDGSRFTFAPANQPESNTGCCTNEKEFIFSLLREKEPTLIFKGGDRIGSHQIKLEEMFPVQFPFGVGGLDKRPTKVSPQETMRHYARISLPQFQRADFILVLYAMFQRAQTFQKSIITCQSKLSLSALGDKLSTITKEQLDSVTKQVLDGRGNNTSNATMNQLFSSISANCKSVGHSNEAAAVARKKCFATWQYFGPPAVFATTSPCDENSLRVRLYATSETHKLPTVEDLMDDSDCFLDLKMRRGWRATYPGACSLEFQSLMQIFINVLLGWDEKKKCGTQGIFGKVLAWTEADEEQARLTLHAHLIIWIEHFNKMRDLLFHSDIEVRNAAKKGLYSTLKKLDKQRLEI